MKLLYLNSVITKANAKGEEKVQKAINKSSHNKNDGSLSKSWFEEQGLKPPEDLEDEDIPNISEDGTIFLKEGEFDYDFSFAILNLKEFNSCINNSIIGSIIYTKDGGEIWVSETAEEVLSQIEYLNLNWLGRIKLKINRLINREK